MRSGSENNPRPTRPPDCAAARRALARTDWIVWIVLSAFIVGFSTVIVGMWLVGDWDDPMPPHPIAAWSVAGAAAAATVLIARHTKVRSLMIASIVALPLQASYWALLVIPAAGQPN